FAAAVPLWAVQGLAARAFYAARDTLTPMIAGTAITLASLPVYAALYRALGPIGLAIASGAGILGHTLALLALAPRVLPEVRPLAGGAARGLGAAALLATLAGAAAWGTARLVAGVVPGRHLAALAVCAAGSLVFAAATLVLAPLFGLDEVRRLLRLRLRRNASRLTAKTPRAPSPDI